MRNLIKNRLHEGLRCYGVNEHKISINEIKNNKFMSFVENINGKPVSGKNNLFVFSEGPTSVYFKNTPERSTIDFDLIETAPEARGSGNARIVFGKFLSYCDDFNFTVKAVVAPRDKQTNLDRLFEFYDSLGFQMDSVNGFESDFEIIRYPH